MGEKKNSTVASGILICVIIALLVAAAASLGPVYFRNRKRQNILNELQKELDARKTESARLHKEVDGLNNSPDMVEKVARERFRLCRPGEIVYEMQPLPQDGQSSAASDDEPELE